MFDATLKEGVFYSDSDYEEFRKTNFLPFTEIYLFENGEKIFIEEIISSFFDTEVMFSMHYLVDLNKPNEWGAGSCLMQSLGWCPCEHHIDPQRILNVSETGYLRKQGEHIYIEKSDKSKEYLPFYLLVGHKGRVALTTVFDVQKIKKSLEADADLLSQVEGLESMIKNIKGAMK